MKKSSIKSAPDGALHGFAYAASLKGVDHIVFASTKAKLRKVWLHKSGGQPLDESKTRRVRLCENK